MATKNDGNLMKYGQERRGRDSGAPSRSFIYIHGIRGAEPIPAKSRSRIAQSPVR